MTFPNDPTCSLPIVEPSRPPEADQARRRDVHDENVGRECVGMHWTSAGLGRRVSRRGQPALGLFTRTSADRATAHPPAQIPLNSPPFLPCSLRTPYKVPPGLPARSSDQMPRSPESKKRPLPPIRTFTDRIECVLALTPTASLQIDPPDLLHRDDPSHHLTGAFRPQTSAPTPLNELNIMFTYPHSIDHLAKTRSRPRQEPLCGSMATHYPLGQRSRMASGLTSRR